MSRITLVLFLLLTIAIFPACEDSGKPNEAGKPGDGGYTQSNSASKTSSGGGRNVKWDQLDGRELNIITNLVRGRQYQGELDSSDDYGNWRFDLYTIDVDVESRLDDEFTLTAKSDAFAPVILMYRDDGDDIWTRMGSGGSDPGSEKRKEARVFSRSYFSESADSGRYLIAIYCTEKDTTGSYTLRYESGFLPHYAE